MITLYCFGPMADLPDGSPFVMKAMMLLKLAGVEFRENRKGLSKAPKGKLPYIDDNGVIVADSTFIRFHLEKSHGIDFDGHLTDEQKAVGWALEKMLEDHLYWIAMRYRWLDDANFARGPAHFFDSAPALLRPLIAGFVRRSVRKALRAQGTSRHGETELATLATRGVDTLATLLGDKPYLFGDRPSSFDASLFAFTAAMLSPVTDWPARDAALSKPNLVAYRDRMMREYFPDRQ